MTKAKKRAATSPAARGVSKTSPGRKTRKAKTAPEAHAAETQRAAPVHGEEIRAALLAWYSRSKRDLPWRRTKDPYAIWLSEVMLQQTRVDTVIPYYERFLKRFPTVQALAEAPIDDVLAAWSGLGYYRRARMLQAGAKAVGDDPIPQTADGLRTIPGVGPYTAGAIASIAFDEATPLVDGNVARVFARLFSVEGDVRTGRAHKEIWRIAGELVPKDRAGDWNQALMELGALLCSPDQPKCLLCPVRAYCSAHASGRETELPLRVGKAKPKEWKRAALVLRRGETVLLGQRKDHLVFGGLYEPPMFDDESEEVPRALRRAAGGALTFVDRVVHVLSHRKMRVRVFTATQAASRAFQIQLESDYKTFRFVKVDQIRDLPLGELSKKVLRTVGIDV